MVLFIFIDLCCSEPSEDLPFCRGQWLVQRLKPGKVLRVSSYRVFSHRWVTCIHQPPHTQGSENIAEVELERAAKHIRAKDGKESVESYVLDMI